MQTGLVAPSFISSLQHAFDAAVDVDSSLRREVELRIERVFPPKSVSDAMQVADAAGDMAVPFLRRGQRFLNARQSAACVRGLAVIGSLEAVQAIAEYADEYSGLVLKEVMRAANRVDPGMFLASSHRYSIPSALQAMRWRTRCQNSA
jgi:hypothetical protein